MIWFLSKKYVNSVSIEALCNIDNVVGLSDIVSNPVRKVWNVFKVSTVHGVVGFMRFAMKTNGTRVQTKVAVLERYCNQSTPCFAIYKGTIN